MRLRRRARHSRLVLELTPDEARTAYLACRDAEAFRRWHTCTPCAQCRSAGTGACARHARDLNLADGYARCTPSSAAMSRTRAMRGWRDDR